MPFVLHTIILADDDDDDREIFQSTVKEIHPHVKVHHAVNGAELLGLLSFFIPDLLFLDLDMPRKNGLECLLAIRQNQALQALPVIVFSSTNKASNIQTAYELGAHLFYQKPSSYRGHVASLTKIFALDWNAPEQIRAVHCKKANYCTFSHDSVIQRLV